MVGREVVDHGTEYAVELKLREIEGEKGGALSTLSAVLFLVKIW